MTNWEWQSATNKSCIKESNSFRQTPQTTNDGCESNETIMFANCILETFNSWPKTCCGQKRNE